MAVISTSFYMRKNRRRANGKSPIYMRIKLDPDYFDVQTKVFAHAQLWDGSQGRLKTVDDDARKTNKVLEGFMFKALDMQRQLMTAGEDITIDAMKRKWYGHSSEKPIWLMPIFEDHNDKMKQLIGKEFSPLTYERYVTSKKHTQEFIRYKYQQDDYDIKKLDYDFISEYDFWFRSVRNCDHNTTVKYLSNFRKIVNICVKSGKIAKDPFFGYKMVKREIDRPFLVEEELTRISLKEFVAPRLNQVRDIFLFSCFTGLAYADVTKLTREEVTIGIDGEKWIWTNRQKTDTRSRIPLLPQALEIIERYADHPECADKGKLLPALSNQKMNNYLKEIADACDITKKMTFHTARHTFATTVTLTNGVPIETVSKMLGHRNLKTTQHYAKILDKKVSEDMMILKSKYRKSEAGRVSAAETN